MLKNMNLIIAVNDNNNEIHTKTIITLISMKAIDSLN